MPENYTFMIHKTESFASEKYCCCCCSLLLFLDFTFLFNWPTFTPGYAAFYKNELQGIVGKDFYRLKASFRCSDLLGFDAVGLLTG